MAIFVLIHGGCHGGWCWERIVPLLRERGHTVFAPDLPGTGSDRTPLSDVTLQGWATFTADLIAQQDEPVILVGHSLGGPVISQAAEFVPDRIKALVYLAAIMPSDGETAGHMVPAPDDSETWVIVSEDQKSFGIPAPIIEKYFYNTTPAEWTARAVEKVTPLPFNVLAEPVSLTATRYGRVPRFYIRTQQDGAWPPDLQDLCLARQPCGKIFELDTDHSPFYSAPERLTEILVTCAGVIV
jgi:pimeloyl-ACP methyl ester carboxylesterase